MHLNHQPMSFRVRGFSLVEVLVALLVISIGLLGIAKMQALALANTNGGRLRALASIEAASLAASMQAERSFWGNLPSTATGLTIKITGGSGSATISASDATQIPNATVSCPTTASVTSATATISPCSGSTGLVTCTSTGNPCTAQSMATYDLQQWAGRLQEVMGPSAAASIVCTTATPPVSCQIIINWYEETVNSNASETSTMGIPSYTLFVNP
jgi:type IV pilus assembly protein PilV